MSGTWCSVQLKKAFEMVYIISTIHAGFSNEVVAGLMKTKVEFF